MVGFERDDTVYEKYNFEIITPWVRFSWNETWDQKRITTPCQAVKNGSTHIVMWRPILESVDIIKTVNKFFDEISWVLQEIKWKYQFEKLLYTWEWIDLLKYIWAIYRKPKWWLYCRLASGLLSDTYINIWASERNYLVLERAWRELTEQLSEKWIHADITMWAQMWSIRLSSYLAEKMWIEESIYVEKDSVKEQKYDDITHIVDNPTENDEILIPQLGEIRDVIKNPNYAEKMALKRNDIDLTWKKLF